MDLMVEQAWGMSQGWASMMLQEELTALGWGVVGIAARTTDAFAMLEANPHLSAAVVDLNLGEEMSAEIVYLLRVRKIPFVVVTGYQDPQILAPYADMSILNKPVTSDEVDCALRRVTGCIR